MIWRKTQAEYFAKQILDYMSEDTDHGGACVCQADAVDGIGGSVLRNHQADALAHTTWKCAPK